MPASLSKGYSIVNQIEQTKRVTALKDVPAGSLFRVGKSGTLYLKLANGSIRNVDKAVRKMGLYKIKPEGQDK